jgi:hypothetical protein
MAVNGGPLDLGLGWQRLVLLLADVTFGNATSFLVGRSLVGLATTVNDYSWTLQEDFPLIKIQGHHYRHVVILGSEAR